MNAANEMFNEVREQRVRAELIESTMASITEGGPAVDLESASALDRYMASTSTAFGDTVVPTRVKRRVEVSDSEVHSIAFLGSGSVFALGGSDKVVKTFDARNGNLKTSFRGCGASVMNVAFSVNEELLLGSSTDESIRVWSVSTGRVRAALTGHTQKIYASDFTSDSTKVVRLWFLFGGRGGNEWRGCGGRFGFAVLVFWFFFFGFFHV